MPFSVGDTINGATERALSNNTIKTIASNPIYTAAIITLVIVLIIMFIFRDVESAESVTILALRGGFWIFIMMVSTLLVYNKVMINDKEIINDNSAYDKIFSSEVTGGASSTYDIEDAFVPIKINNNILSKNF